MNQLTYYYDLMSQPCRSLYIFLSINKIPFISKEVNIGMGEHLSDEYTKINPLHQVPAIVDGDFKLTESIAIIRYLCNERHDIADHWYPKDNKARARVDEYLEFQHIGLRMHCTHYFRVKFLDRVLRGKEASAKYEGLVKKNMIKACDTFQEIWLGNKPYICGDKISIADVFAASELEQTKLAGYDVREGRPALTAWLERVRRETQPYYDLAQATLNRLTLEFMENPPAKY